MTSVPADPNLIGLHRRPVTGRRRSARARRFVGAARVGTRSARRELGRHPLRTLLVITMVGVPVLAMTLATVWFRTDTWTASGRQAAGRGTADAQASLAGTNAVGIDPASSLGTTGRVLVPTSAELATLRAALPAGTRTELVTSRPDRLAVGFRRSELWVTDLSIPDPVNRGRFGRLQGHVPASAGQVVVSTDVAHHLGLGLGADVRFPSLGRSLRVVGIVPVRSGASMAFVASRLPAPTAAGVLIDRPGVSAAGVPLGVPVVEPNAAGWVIEPTTLAGNGNAATAIGWTFVLGAVLLAVLATIIVAAFAVGARRQLRSIGLIAAGGATRATVRWFLVAQGVVAGLLGSLAGAGLGVAIAVALPGWMREAMAGRPIDHVAIHASDVLGIVVLGTAVATAAAAFPARAAARTPVLHSLAGHRPVGRVPGLLPVLGLVAAIAGCAALAATTWAEHRSAAHRTAVELVAVAGGLALLFGAIAVIPWVMAAVERASGGLPVSWRLAGRSVARSRLRSSAVAGALCAVAGLVLAVSTMVWSTRAAVITSGSSTTDHQVVLWAEAPVGQSSPGPWTVPASVRREVQAVVPTARPATIQLLQGDDGGGGGVGQPVSVLLPQPAGAAGSRTGSVVDPGSGELALATPAVLDAFAVPSRLRRVLDQGQAIALRPVPASVHRLTTSPGSVLSVPIGGSFASPQASDRLPDVLVDARTATRLHLHRYPSVVILFVQRRPVSRAQATKLQAIASDLSFAQYGGFSGRPSPSGSVVMDFPTHPLVTLREADGMVLAVAVLLMLAVVAVGLSLAAQDSEDERTVLAAVGAAPRTLRRVGAARSFLLAAVGVAIAVPAGLAGGASVVWAGNHASDVQSNPLRVDGWALAVILLLPVVAAAVTWAGAAVRGVFRPSRPLVFASPD